MRNSKRAGKKPQAMQPSDFLLQGQEIFNPFAIGSWTPNVDICETESRILVRAELPGVNLADIALSFQGNSLRLQGIKRESVQSHKLLCYYCMERRYGKFDRYIGIDWIVNPRLARAHFDKGILTIELPKLKDRRGETVAIQVREK